MQYILTEEEYLDLTNQVKEAKSMPNKKALQEFCTMVAENLPVKGGWFDGNVWGCILTHNEEKDGEWYCDECPAQRICPYQYKSWSK